VVLSRIRPNLPNKFSNLYWHCIFIKFRHHLYISHASPDDGLSRPKCVVNGIVKILVCVTVTPSVLYLSAKNRMQHHKMRPTYHHDSLYGRFLKIHSSRKCYRWGSQPDSKPLPPVSNDSSYDRVLRCRSVQLHQEECSPRISLCCYHIAV
jgi:hypothetical protein